MTEDIGDDLNITSVKPRDWGGTWVTGTISGHRFDALVFEEHAESESYELTNSRISKLWVQRLADKATTFTFDRGLEVDAMDETTKQIVGFLCAGLADHIFSK